ncbi:MAG: AAA family ATPase [Terriglobia bacterium]
MLIQFRAQNHRSIREQQELSLVASSLKDVPQGLIQAPGFEPRLLPVAALYGANASGKTNVLKALDYMSGAVKASQRHWQPDGPIPRDPFLLDEEFRKQPSTFEVDILLEGTRYQYGFTLNSERILEEWLYAYPSGKRQTWFTRASAPEKNFKFGKNLTGENRAIEALTRDNSLFLSAAAQNNHAALLPIYNWFSNSFSFVPGDRGPLQFFTAEMCVDEGHRRAVTQLLRAADLGVVGLDVREVDYFDTTEAPEGARKFMEALKAAFAALPDVHLTGKTRKICLRHRSRTEEGVQFSTENESDGTVAFFGLLGPVVRALEAGGTVCIDELDSSLHPLLAIEVVRLFNDPKRNPKGAQLIFTTHDTNLLDTSLLRRDQIWFTEKDSAGGTHLYPLSDFKPRRNENLERGYLQGRYGAVPFIGSTDILTSQKHDA